MRLLIQLILCSLGLFLLVSAGALAAARQRPAVSASWIAFDSSREGNRQLFMMRPDGSLVQQITDSRANDSSPAWSPDGMWIAFSSNERGNPDIYRVQPNGENRQQLTHALDQDVYPAWSPDGKFLLFSSNRNQSPDLYRIDADGLNPEAPVLQTRLHEITPAWSPDGEWIVFSSNIDGNYDIYKMHPDGSDLHNLTNDGSWNTYPVWSDDGQWIVFASDRTGNFDIFKMREDGSHLQNLMPDQTQNPLSGSNSWDNYPTLSPGDEWIAFASDRDGDFDIYRMRFDGSDVQNLTDSHFADSYPAWSPPVDLPWRVGWLLLLGTLFLLGIRFARNGVCASFFNR